MKRWRHRWHALGALLAIGALGCGMWSAGLRAEDVPAAGADGNGGGGGGGGGNGPGNGAGRGGRTQILPDGNGGFIGPGGRRIFPRGSFRRGLTENAVTAETVSDVQVLEGIKKGADALLPELAAKLKWLQQ